MKLSKYYLPTLREVPSEASIISHKLMLRSGMIRQNTSGIYTFLPLGLAVLSKIENIIRKTLNESDCLEILMPTIQPASLWQESGRYDDYGLEMLRIKDRHDRDLLYGPTNEEMIVDLFKQDIQKYKSMPLNLYHIQWKFRDEIRPRFGVMRCREFLMMDAYSFAENEESAMRVYNLYYKVYLEIFKRLDLLVIPVKASSGAIGGNLSHEFHVVANTGESALFYDPRFENLLAKDEINIDELKSLYSAADDEHDNNYDGTVKSVRGIEVGHIFYFGQKYSQPMKAKITSRDGNSIIPYMGSYGIGVTRLIGAIIESSHDEYGIIFNEKIAPFHIHLIAMKKESLDITESLYRTIMNAGIDVIFDDDVTSSIGIKLSIADLIGMPYQIRVFGENCSIVRRSDFKKIEIRTESLLSEIKSGKLLSEFI